MAGAVLRRTTPGWTGLVRCEGFRSASVYGEHVFRRPGGRRGPGLGLVRSTVLTLLIATAGALVVLSAMLVVSRVPPLTDQDAPAAGAALRAAPAAAPVAATDTAPDPVPGVPRLAVLGDTFTTGTSGAATATWPQVVCERIGCQYVPDLASPGTGYVTPGADGLAAGARLDTLVAARPDVVVVAVGASDVGVGQPRISGSVNKLLFQLERDLPDARVVVLSPFWPSAPAPPEVIAVRGWIYHATTKHQDTFINVTDLFDDAHRSLVAPDGAAPDELGQQYVADTVQQLLQAAVYP